MTTLFNPVGAFVARGLNNIATFSANHQTTTAAVAIYVTARLASLFQTAPRSSDAARSPAAFRAGGADAHPLAAPTSPRERAAEGESPADDKAYSGRKLAGLACTYISAAGSCFFSRAGNLLGVNATTGKWMAGLAVAVAVVNGARSRF